MNKIVSAFNNYILLPFIKLSKEFIYFQCIIMPFSKVKTEETISRVNMSTWHLQCSHQKLRGAFSLIPVNLKSNFRPLACGKSKEFSFRYQKQTFIHLSGELRTYWQSKCIETKYCMTINKCSSNKTLVFHPLYPDT